MSRSSRTIGPLLVSLVAVAALLLVVVGVPVALVLLVGWPVPSPLPTVDELNDIFSGRSPLPADYLISAVAIVLWILWAQVAWATVVEVVATARGRLASTAHVLPGIQTSVGKLVAAATLVASSLGTRPVAAGTLPAVPTSVATAPIDERVTSSPDEVVDGRTAREPVVYLTRPGDTWWGIAEDALGSGTRWKEIRGLNIGRTMPDGYTISAATDLLRPDWRLLLPASADPAAVRAAAATSRQASPSPSRSAAATASGQTTPRSANTAESTATPPPTTGDPTAVRGLAPVAERVTAEGRQVVVARGDSIWAIAQADLIERDGQEPEEMAVAAHANAIARLNRPQLAGDPDMIYPGQTLLLPVPGQPDGPVVDPASVSPAPVLPEQARQPTASTTASSRPTPPVLGRTGSTSDPDADPTTPPRTITTEPSSGVAPPTTRAADPARSTEAPPTSRAADPARSTEPPPTSIPNSLAGATAESPGLPTTSSALPAIGEAETAAPTTADHGARLDEAARIGGTTDGPIDVPVASRRSAGLDADLPVSGTAPRVESIGPAGRAGSSGAEGGPGGDGLAAPIPADDALSTGERTAPVFVGLAALTLVGAYLHRARGRRRDTALRHRHPGRRPSPPKGRTRTLSRRLAAAAGPDHPELVNLGLRALGHQLRSMSPERLPEIAGVWISHDRMVVALTDDSPRPAPPAPFTEFIDGGWTLRRTDFEHARDLAGGANGPLPLLVTLGRTSALDLALTTGTRDPADAYGLSTNLLFAVDLEPGRVISVLAADHPTTIETLTMMALELATSETADQAEIVCVGFGHRLASLERVRVVDDLAAAIHDLEAVADRAVDAEADASPFATRVGGGAADTWNPVVVFHADPTDPHTDTLVELAHRTTGGVTAVCGYPTDLGWTIEVEGDRLRCLDLPGELGHHEFVRPQLDGTDLVPDLLDEPAEEIDLDDGFWQPMEPVVVDPGAWPGATADDDSWRPMGTVTDHEAAPNAVSVADRGLDPPLESLEADRERRADPEALWDDVSHIDPDSWPEAEAEVDPVGPEVDPGAWPEAEADPSAWPEAEADSSAWPEPGGAGDEGAASATGPDPVEYGPPVPRELRHSIERTPGSAPADRPPAEDGPRRDDEVITPAAEAEVITPQAEVGPEAEVGSESDRGDDGGDTSGDRGRRRRTAAAVESVRALRLAERGGSSRTADSTRADGPPRRREVPDVAPTGGEQRTHDRAGDVPPADLPSADAPAADVPAADAPPATRPPADAPPGDRPRADTPPGDRPPANVPGTGLDDRGAFGETAVRVSILGNLTIEGHHVGDRRKPWKYTKTPELILYLLLHPEGASQDLLMERLFPEQPPNRPRLNQLVSDARTKALGLNADGEYHLPHASPTEPFYRLLPSVGFDLRDFARHCANAKRAESIEVQRREWTAALRLVRGRPFTVPHDGYEWALSEVEATIVKVEEAASALADLAFELGDHELAVWATKQGLRTGTGYYDLLVKRGKAALLLQDPEEIVRAFADLQTSLDYGGAPEEGMPDVHAHPELADIYDRLSTGRSADRFGSRPPDDHGGRR